MRKQKKFYETNEFKQVQNEWYSKLKSEGFRDIESGDKNVISKQFFDVDLELLTYFQKCNAFLESGAIKDPLDAFIFKNHCEGKPTREIESLLKTTSLIHITRRPIDVRILKILKVAGIDPVDFGNV